MDSNESITPEEEITNSEGELSHSDKMIGVFTEPSKMFSHTSKFPPRNKDWVIPVLILFLVVGLVQRIALTNEEVYFDVMQKQTEQLDKQVESGELTREEADQQAEAIDTFTRGPFGWITTIVGALIGGFIVFIIAVGIYYLFIKFLLKGEGTFTSALVANGLTAYISILQIVIAGIITMLMGKMIMDTSLASLMDADKNTMTGWILARLDPISIWAYIVLAIGFAKMFKSESTGRYYALVFGWWLISMFILFQLSQSVSFLQNFM
jgi:hypothetical protein